MINVSVVEKDLKSIRLTFNPNDGRVTLKLPTSVKFTPVFREALIDFSKYVVTQLKSIGATNTMRGKIKGNLENLSTLDVTMCNNNKAFRVHLNYRNGEMDVTKIEGDIDVR